MPSSYLGNTAICDTMRCDHVLTQTVGSVARPVTNIQATTVTVSGFVYSTNMADFEARIARLEALIPFETFTEEDRGVYKLGDRVIDVQDSILYIWTAPNTTPVKYSASHFVIKPGEITLRDQATPFITFEPGKATLSTGEELIEILIPADDAALLANYINTESQATFVKL